MSVNQYVESVYWVQEERQDQPSVFKLTIAFVIGLLVMSPAILGIYWEWILPK
jgi:hypothetical protein